MSTEFRKYISDEPDYENYSLDELRSVAASIDRDSQPERYETVRALISEKSQRQIVESLQTPRASRGFFESLVKGPEDSETALRVVRYTVIVAVVLSIFQIGLVAYSFSYSGSDKELIYLLDPWQIIDAGLVFVFALFVYKHKRWAAIALLLHRLSGVFLAWYDLGKFPGAIPVLTMMLYFGAILSITYINNEKVSQVETT